MGLIKSAIKYGALFGIANQGFKALEHSSQNSQQQQPQVILQQPPPYQNQNNGSSRDASSYRHQPFCNGNCGGRCHLLEGNQEIDNGFMNTNFIGELNRYVNPGYVREQNDGSKAFTQ
jgi:hypothetical protein